MQARCALTTGRRRSLLLRLEQQVLLVLERQQHGAQLLHVVLQLVAPRFQLARFGAKVGRFHRIVRSVRCCDVAVERGELAVERGELALELLQLRLERFDLGGQSGCGRSGEKRGRGAAGSRCAGTGGAVGSGCHEEAAGEESGRTSRLGAKKVVVERTLRHCTTRDNRQ